MAFLDNSGDIILDAVLTDYGRMQLAKNTTDFIVKFALGDDEVNYSLWNGSHPSGSAYYDLDIVQTPVLEAFANNASSMKYSLYSDTLATDLLYLPVMKVYSNSSNTYFYGTAADAATSTNSTKTIDGGVSYYSGSVVLLSANSTTDTNLKSALSPNTDEFIQSTGKSVESARVLRIDVGLDNSGASRTMLSDLRTSTIMIKYDSRLLSLADKNLNPLSAIGADDDSVETVLTDSSNVVYSLVDSESYSNSGSGALTNTSNGYDCIISLSIVPKAALQGNDYYFTLLGRSSETVGSSTFKTIDTNIQIISEDTGTSINIPVKICKS